MMYTAAAGAIAEVGEGSVMGEDVRGDRWEEEEAVMWPGGTALSWKPAVGMKMGHRSCTMRKIQWWAVFRVTGGCSLFRMEVSII